MGMIHDLIKMKYVREGYLSNYPYHMISDKEMFDAFIDYTIGENSRSNSKIRYFNHNYPCLDSSLSNDYDNLKSEIICHINQFLTDSRKTIPDWVYSYMLGEVISIHSNKQDIHHLLVQLGVDNIDDIFTSSAAKQCLRVSKSWIATVEQSAARSATCSGVCSSCDKYIKSSSYVRTVPTIFGEPHVLKSLRINPIVI